MNRQISITSNYIDNKSKLYFSKKELTKILQYYSFGVSKGRWKDYSIQFEINTAYFHIYKNFSEKPLLSIFKKKEKRKKTCNYQLSYGYNNLNFNEKLENLFIYLNRKNIKLIK